MEFELETKEIEINWKGSPLKIKIREIAWNDKVHIESSAFINKVVGKQIVREIQEEVLKKGYLEKCIVEAPFEFDKESLGKMPGRLMQMIYDQIDELHTLTEKKKVESSGPTSTEPSTQETKI